MIPEWLTTIPGSTIFVLLVSMLLTFASSLINRLFTSKEQREKLVALRHEMGKLTKEKNEDLKRAKSTGDKKLLKKVRKQEKQILQLQAQMASLSFRQMRVFPITMVMFLLFWAILTGRLLYWPVLPGLFTGAEIVAKIPWLESGVPFELNLVWWYLLCSFLFGTLFSRIFGLTGGTE